jgi:hypothetical protein
MENNQRETGWNQRVWDFKYLHALSSFDEAESIMIKLSEAKTEEEKIKILDRCFDR